MKSAAGIGFALLLAGCGTTAPAAQGEHPVTAAKRSSEMLQEPPLACEVTLTLPNGWKRTSPSVLTNGALEARVDIMVGKSTKPVELELKQFCRMLAVDGWHCENGNLADDGSEGAFPFDTARRHGYVAVRHYADGTAIILRGEWPKQSDRKARKDFAVIFSSIDPQ